MIFKCKNCGGNVVYSPERKKMFCPFCESEDSEERQDGVIETSGDENSIASEASQAAGADQPEGKLSAAEGEALKKVNKVCPNCGGEIPMTASTSATQCPYCDNYVIVDDQIAGSYTPHMVEKQDNMIFDMENAKANIYSYPLVTSDVFKTLEDCCPDKVLITITGYNCATGELQFDAVAPEVTDVSEVIEIWKTLDIFQGVYFTGYTQNQAQDGYTVKVVCILSEHAGRQAADEN